MAMGGGYVRKTWPNKTENKSIISNVFFFVVAKNYNYLFFFIPKLNSFSKISDQINIDLEVKIIWSFKRVWNHNQNHFFPALLKTGLKWSLKNRIEMLIEWKKRMLRKVSLKNKEFTLLS